MSASELPEDIVRVLRIIEYTGPRSVVEECVARSIQGEKRVPGGQRGNSGAGELVIRAATIGAYPEILQAAGTTESSSMVPWPQDRNGPIELPECPPCGARSNMPCTGLGGLRLQLVHESRSRAAAVERPEPPGRRKGHFLIIGKHTGMPIGCMDDPTLVEMVHMLRVDQGTTFREVDADQCPCCKSFEVADTEIVEGEPGNG